MTKRFLNMWPFIKQVEGTVFENDPDDPGGETRWGVDKRSHPDVDIRNLTEGQAQLIYWNDYWQANRCEKMPFPLGEVYFDVCVNNGKCRAKKFAEQTCDAGEMLKLRDQFYRDLAEARPKSRKYLKGWLNRNSILRRHLGIA